MNNKKAILAIKDFIVSSEKSLKSAKKLLTDLAKENNIDLNSKINLSTSGLHSYSDEDNKIIEGVFTGEAMLGSDGKNYPVPVNYSSKSKMVQGDKLKLTIDSIGKMTYKQISPIEREIITGLVTKDDGKFQVVCEGDTYDLLTAAITHFGCEVGDTISILLPKGKKASFAAIEAIIPKE